jgi:hypothetical protein
LVPVRFTEGTTVIDQLEHEAERVRELAQQIECISEADFCLLADITPGTAEAWRKRGKGPAYALIGNRYLYPRQAVAEFMAGAVRQRRTISAKDLL